VTNATLPAPNELPEFSRRREPNLTTALAVIWSVDQPERCGEVVLLPSDGRTGIFGRADDAPEDPDTVRLKLVQMRPGTNVDQPPITSPHISRVQLRITPAEQHGLQVSSVGQCPMIVNGEVQSDAVLAPGDVLELKKQLAFVCVRRPRLVDAIERLEPGPFGRADAHGIVGESAAVWDLRSAIARLAHRSAHVLVHGPSGSGKELVAQAIHAAGPDPGPLVCRNAATLPEGLVDAELFGNLRNYPNPGMTERAGLVGDASGGTLFLDEIGELPSAAQAHMLRVLDAGEYQRLGESRSRRSRFRLIAATNRDPAKLKSDVLARMKLRVTLQGLNGRAEDVPLLARHLLGNMALEDPSLAERFFTDADPSAEPRLTPRLIQQLVRHSWTTNVRELESLLWRSVDESRGTYLDAIDGLSNKTENPASEDISAAQIQAAMERHGGVREKVWRDLGLRNRHVLTRLMKKHGLTD